MLADGIAVFVAPVFSAAEHGKILTIAEAWGGALCYTFRLYFDFSGYSDRDLGWAARYLFGHQSFVARVVAKISRRRCAEPGVASVRRCADVCRGRRRLGIFSLGKFLDRHFNGQIHVRRKWHHAADGVERRAERLVANGIWNFVW